MPIIFITLKTYGKDQALIAGVLCATEFSAAYFVLTNYDAFPKMFLMIGLMLTIYGLKKEVISQ